jgi:hypothetical protein
MGATRYARAAEFRGLERLTFLERDGKIGYRHGEKGAGKR